MKANAGLSDIKIPRLSKIGISSSLKKNPLDRDLIGQKNLTMGDESEVVMMDRVSPANYTTD